MSLNRKELAILSFLVFAMTLIKFYFCLDIQTPAVMGDEACYIVMAHDFVAYYNFFETFKNSCPYPGGYPLILSIAFLFNQSFEGAFRIIQLLNCFISSFILIPIYIILRYFKKEQDTLLIPTALMISTVPSIIGYFFWVMSENLFALLVVLSFYLLIKLNEKRSALIAFIFGFINFYAFFTRETGIALNIASIFALLFILERNEIRNNLKILGSFLAGYLILTIAWILYRINTAGKISGYNVQEYVSGIPAITDFSGLLGFLRLFYNEILYIFVAGYIIFTILAFWKIFDFTKKRDTRSIAIFVSVFLLLLTLIATDHMWLAKKNPGYYDYDVLGRYIDPIIPIIFILGFIKLIEFRGVRKLATLGVLSITTLFLVLLTFPITNYKPTNNVAIYYLLKVNLNTFIFLFLVLLFLVYFFIIFFRSKFKTLAHLLIVVFFLVSSLFTTSHYYEWYDNNQKYFFDRNHEIIYLISKISLNSVYLDLSDRGERSSYHFYFYSLWSLPKKIVSSKFEKITNEEFYIITDKDLLTCEILSSSKFGYKLYYCKII